MTYLMTITVLTPDKEIFQGRIESVKVPGVSGEFQVLKNHAPLVSALEAGQVTVVTAAGEHRYFDEESGTIKTTDEAGKSLIFQIGGGFLEVLNNELALLVSGVQEKVAS